MSSAIIRRVQCLADSLTDLKIRVRTALSTELASAVGTAVRDVVAVAIVERFANGSARSADSTPRPDEWRDDDRDGWRDSQDQWANDTMNGHDHRDDAEPMPAVPPALAVAVGVNVGRWWLARTGTVAAAVGVGMLATALGLVGGPVTRAAIAVLAAAADLLTAESALAPPGSR